MATARLDLYRRSFFAPEDKLFRHCLAISSALGMVFLWVVLQTPIRHLAITRVEQLPKRFAKLIIEPARPAPVATPKPPVEQPKAAEAKPEPQPEPPRLRARRIEETAPLPPDAGLVGRERAKTEVTSTLERSRASLEKSLAGLSASLKSAGVAEPPRPAGRRRSRSVASGRSDGQIADVEADVGGSGGADLGGSTVKGSLVAIGTLSAPGVSGSGVVGSSGSEASTSGGSAPGVYRSNASLLAVIQKYAAGIQYCYGNELKRDPGLAGKIVVALSVAASGDVLEAKIIQDTVGSDRLTSCALSQIRQWKFPPIASGVTTFQTPFVFTPPN